MLGLAIINRNRGHFTAAARLLESALALSPADANLAGMYGAVLGNIARSPEVAAFTGRWLAANSDSAVASMHAHALNYAPGIAPETIFEAHARFGRSLPAATPPSPADRNPDRRLRVGILSNDLRRHSVAAFMEPLLRYLDRGAFELWCYDTHPAPDEVTARLKKLIPHWASVASLDDAALTARIRADRIDLLIETSGLTRGHRLGVLALRAAPVQVTYCGYPCTTGVPAVDARIVDSLTDPPGAVWSGPEHLERLDPVFLCFQPPADAPRPSASDPRRPLTFGSFNAAAKLNDPVITLWSRILRQLPDSRLLLKAFDFKDPELRADLAARFARHEIDPARLEILPPTDQPADHLSLYGRVDIALDTFPYNGTTTTCEALWMGVPVVSLVGTLHAGRVGLSLLSAVGLERYAVSDPDAYVAAALTLGTDPAERSRLRSSLRPTLESSPLCDGPGFAARFGAALRTLWRRYAAPTP